MAFHTVLIILPQCLEEHKSRKGGKNLIVLKFMECRLSFEMSLVLAGWRGSRVERETGKRPRTKGIKKKIYRLKVNDRLKASRKGSFLTRGCTVIEKETGRCSKLC